MKNQTRFFQVIGYVEGLSYLILLFIAMPLKYQLGYPLPTRIVGSIHGLLTILFFLALLGAHRENRWGYGKSFAYAVASLIPFGFIWIEQSLKKEIAARNPAPPAP